MKKFFLGLFFSAALSTGVQAQTYKADSANMKRISNYILSNYHGYNDLHDLCKNIGHRLTGSPQAAAAVKWGEDVLKKAGCDRVFLQEVMVPHWVRGHEKANLISKSGKKTPLLISSLGNAVGTGAAGLKSELIMINHIDDLKRMNPDQVKGKIVFYNFRFDQTNVNTFESYGPCVYYRWGAPSEASKLGAKGVVIRSVSSAFDDKPHTGSVSYDKTISCYTRCGNFQSGCRYAREADVKRGRYFYSK
jgi:carboxypeptidase Q